MILFFTRKNDKSLNTLINGVLIGNTFVLTELYLNEYSIPNVIENLTEQVIPSIYNITPVITIILALLLIYMGIKKLIKNRIKRNNLILAVSFTILYLFTYIFSKNIVLNSLAFTFYQIAAFYILFNYNNSFKFKGKVKYLYLFKLVFILVLSLVNNIEPGYTLFISLIDIIVILCIIDYMLPTNYLYWLWVVLSGLLISFNIYIYSNVEKKYQNLNEYIIYELESGKDIINPQLKYETNYLYKYIPSSREEKKVYLSYYEINYKGKYQIYFDK